MPNRKVKKGIILAGGAGTRLGSLTKVTSKQLLPLYNQPMIYFPLKTLLSAGINEIFIIVAPDHAGDFLKLLGSGKEFNAKFTYEIQDAPEGIAQAILIGKTFVGQDKFALILGDNIFEDNFKNEIQSFEKGARVFAKEVTDPERFGVVVLENETTMKATKIIEKPKIFLSNLAVTGLYVYDSRAISMVEKLTPSSRHELEITDLNNMYVQLGELDVKKIPGAWLDTGTFESLFLASEMVRKWELAKENYEDPYLHSKRNA